MGEECANLGGDDFELSLELSIGGGKYGISRSNDSPLQKKRSLKKSRKIESLAERRRRGIGEIDGFLGERFRNNEKSGGGIAINDNDADDFFDLSLSLFTQEPQPLNPSSSSNSPVSDYQTTSQRGGSSTDTGSNSSPLHGVAPAKSVRPPPSIQSQPMWGPSLDNNNNNNNNPGPVKPVHMPCVTTTGNGADGKTVRGFLHKYSNAEVSIVCVCHGSSFSPAGFVEHAGGVGVSNPLRHITVVRSVFGSL